MTTLIMVGGGILLTLVMMLIYGYAKKKVGKNEQKNIELAGEIETARKANQLRDSHKHDSRPDIANGL